LTRLFWHDECKVTNPMTRKDIIHQITLALVVAALFWVLSFAHLGLFRQFDQAFFEWNTSFLGHHTPAPSKTVVIRPGPKDSHRPGPRYLGLGLLVLLGIVMSFLSPRLNESRRAYLLLGLLIVSVGTASFSGALFRTPFPLALLLASLAAIYLALTFYRAHSLETVASDYFDANRALGLNLQSQGHLDQALERFKACPVDRDTRELLYQLGLDFEGRGMPGKALMAYEHIRCSHFKDVQNRIRQLKSEAFPELIPGGTPFRQGSLSESLIQTRKQIGRYQVMEKLGKGTMGLVYKGLDPKLNRLVALKIIRFSDDFDEEMTQEIKERFLREAEIAGRLSHPGIVTIYDVGEDRDLTYMAMEYLEGNNLIKYCSKESRLPLTAILDAIAKVADALHYAHQQGVIHRDIKPANIMLLKDGGVKVTDFGIAKAISSSRTKTGVILGTPNYMSPEQIMGHRIDARTDIFSLGVLFFQLLSGQLPFHGDNLSGLLFQITQGSHPSVRHLEPRIPKACEQIIDKALSKDPANRFKSAGQMARYLSMLLLKMEEMSKIGHDSADQGRQATC
jgi:predicted Ser/Thr protein kinase